MSDGLRNFKDFLQLYNTLTEYCFKSCVDNLYSRNISPQEDFCVDNCVNKFANVNQRLMGVYVEVQNDINSRRMKEYEIQLQAQQAQLELQQQAELKAQQAQIQTPELQTPPVEQIQPTEITEQVNPV